jgi:hypothetical protein
MNSKSDFLDAMKKWTVRPCTLKDLRELYHVSYKVLKTHITAHENEIGKRIGRYYMTNQVIIIIKTFGPPPDVDVVLPNGMSI